MPRHPELSSTVRSIQGGVFSRLQHRIAKLTGEVYKFHVGDTWMEPPIGARFEDVRVAEYPGMHQYTVPHGHPLLLAALERRRGVSRDEMLVTAGATGGLACATTAITEPGEEVVILAPFWPLIRGIVQAARAVPVEVPFFGRPGTADERIAPFLSPRTVAVYVNTPHNPTGQVLDRAELEDVVALCRRAGLYLLSDEVYEDYVYVGEHVSLRTLAPERTFVSTSFSKAYGMAGNRVGALLGPKDAMVEARKVGTHSCYAAPTGAQIAAARVLELGADWVAEARETYASVGRRTAEMLGVPAPSGGTFLWVDVANRIDERGVHGFLEDCLDDNLILAPGASFGADFPTHVRLCFTAMPPDVTLRGAEKLARRLQPS